MDTRPPMVVSKDTRPPMVGSSKAPATAQEVKQPAISIVQANPTQQIAGVVSAKPNQTITGVKQADTNKAPIKVSGANPLPGAYLDKAPAPTKQLPRASDTPESTTASLMPQTMDTYQLSPDEIAWQERSKMDMVKDLVKSPIKDLIVTPGVRMGQVLAEVIKPGSAADKDVNIKIPGLGSYDIKAQKTGMAGAKQIAGQGLAAASWIYTPEKVVGVGRELLNDVALQSIKDGVNITDKLVRDALWNTIKKSATQGAIIGSFSNLGTSLQDDKSWSDNAKDFVIGGVFGAGLGAATAGAAGGLMIAKNKIAFVQKQLMQELIDRGLTPEHAQKLVAQGGYLGDVLGGVKTEGPKLPNPESITVETLKPGSYVKERGFMTSLKEHPDTQAIFQDVVDNYNPRVNKDDIATVRAMSIMEPEKYKLLVDSSRNSAESTIAKVMYLKDAIKSGDISTAKEMASILSKRGTELGQAVQSYKTLGMDLGDPAKALVVAQKEFDKAGMQMSDKVAEDIIKQSDFISKLPDTAKYEKFKQTQNLLKIISDSLPVDLGENIKNVLNVPRTLMASMDLSFGLRQGLVAAWRHPVLWGKAFAAQFKMFGSEAAYEDLMNTVLNHPDFELAKKAGVSFTDIGSKLSTREEQYMSNYAEKIPLLGKLVRASDRAYTGMANKLRIDVFSSLVNDAEKIGLHPREDAKLSMDMARLVNDLTGRGSLKLGILGNYEKSAPLLNTIFFSPRLMLSRLSLLTSPVSYLSTEPFVRKEALKSMLAFSSGTMTILGLAKLAGLEVSADPRNSDFGKIKIGNTRLDILGGFQQYIRMGGQVISGKYISSTTGKEYTLGEGYKPMTRLNIVGRQLESKEAPVVSFITDWLRGTDYSGEKVTLTNSIVKRLTPMIIQDMTDLYNDDPNLLPLGLVGSFGIGLQTYGQAPKSKSGGGFKVKKSSGGKSLKF